LKTLLLLLLLNLGVVAPPAMAATPGEVPAGSVLREAPLQPLFGKARKLSDFRGKPLIINVWASWCGPCRDEMGSLERLSRRYGEQLAVIGISTDDYPERARAFLQKSGTTFANFIDHQLVLENMLGADRLPLTLLVDAQGRILSKHYGAREWDHPDTVKLIGKAFQLTLR
jgi:thiol-disulfide isomerase/thioredoxin